MATKRRIRVTRRQVDAAKSTLEADRLLGRESNDSVVRIANAKPVAVQTAPQPSR